MRALKILVVVMGVLIVSGTVTLVALVVQRAGGFGGGGAARLELALEQPAGTRIGGIAATEQALAIWVQRPDGTETVLLVDPRRGRVTGEVRPGAAGVPMR